MATRKKATAKKAATKKPPVKPKKGADFPGLNLERALRIPKAIVEQNAGKACTSQQAASYLGINYGPTYRIEASATNKFGLLAAPERGKIAPSELALKILRPQSPQDELVGLQEAILNAPTLGDVYRHYRGENLPDTIFFRNALADNFNVSQEKLDSFIQVFLDSITFAHMGEEKDGKFRLFDVDAVAGATRGSGETTEIKRLGKKANVESGDSCFVMMPFAPPIGSYYEKIYEPAIKKAGLTPVRADDDIFGTGKIIDQIWRGINNSRVLVAELTNRNPNVFYELGLAHALNKPVVLVSSNEGDVPFDLKHIRVIYYDMHDPFWGNKLIEKIAENVLSAIANPEEAVFQSAITK
tara:strand:+ start:2432 stop:3496 length:1065 start_codon:yes stop_codon:yes gene_type:complete